jgi:heat shock protein HtpX
MMAVAFIVLFYVGGIVLGVTGIALPFLVNKFTSWNVPPLVMLIAGVFGAYALGATFASPFVGEKKWKDPGPRLSDATHPELFALVEDVSRRMHTRPPEVVYLVSEANAFVAEHRKPFTLRRTRVLGLGLPLLHVYDRSELRATLAHELGHYAGSDTLISGLVHTTRIRIMRALAAVDESGSESSLIDLGRKLVHELLGAYSRLFMSLTQAVSRQQELEADRASVELAGTQAHVSGLEKDHEAGLLYSVYLNAEVGPMLEVHAWPEDFWGGYVALTQQPGIRTRASELVKTATTSPYDSHPSLPDRIAFARSLPACDEPRDARPALGLLDLSADPNLLREVEFSIVDASKVDVHSLRRVAWAEVTREVHDPVQREHARRVAELLHPHVGGPTYVEMVVRCLDYVRMDGPWWLATTLEPTLRDVTFPSAAIQQDAMRDILGQHFGALVGVALVEKGGVWRTSLGEPLVVDFRGFELHPGRLAVDASTFGETNAWLRAHLVRDSAAAPALPNMPTGHCDRFPSG